MKITLSLFILLFYIQLIYVNAQTDGLQTDLAGAIDIIVADYGSGDFTTVQEAVNAVPDYSSSRTVIFIKNGTYREKIVIPESKTNLTIIGEDVDSTIISWDDYSGKVVGDVTLGTSTSYSIEIRPDDFWAMNLTFANTAGNVGQAVAVKTMGDRQVFLHCKFLGWQDTYYTYRHYRNYLKDCWIEGAVDFIFGNTTAIFDSCQINTLRDGGMLTAASTDSAYQFGYVFFNCRLTAPPDITGVYLGRPWRPFAHTVFFKCFEGQCINSTGWLEWSGKENTCYYAEYKCTGPGSDTTFRKAWSHQLTDAQAENYTLVNIFSKENKPDVFTADWDPAVNTDSLYKIILDHTIMYLDSIHLSANLKSLKYNNTDIAGFNPDVYNYVIEFPEGIIEIPLLNAVAKSPDAKIEITDPASMPGWAHVTVLAPDKASYNTYNIYYSVNNSYTNARLDSIKVRGSLISNFDPEVFQYDVVLPEKTSIYLPVSGYAQVSEAKVVVTRPSSFPGVATIVVTAVDNITTLTYSINLSITTDIQLKEKVFSEIIFENPVRQNISFIINIDQPTSVLLKIYNSTGILSGEKDFGNMVSGKHYLCLDETLASGVYFYQLHLMNKVTTGEFVKIE